MARRTSTVVWTALVEAAGFVSAQELHRRLTNAGVKIGLTTVYRVLADLEVNGQVEAIAGAHETLFCACRIGHHHHLVCVLCGHAVPLDTDVVEEWVRTTSAAAGFQALSHTLELRGVCATCPAP